MKKLLLSFIMSLVSLASWAYDVEVDGLFYFLFPGTGIAKVSGGDWKYEGNVVIPATITYSGRQFTVTEVGTQYDTDADFPFCDCPDLLSIEFPNTVTKVGEIMNCDKLKSLTLPNSVTYFGGCSGCKNLESVQLSENLSSIENAAFMYDTKLEKITIPNSVTSIGQWPFEGCTRLKSVVIGEQVSEIWDRAFVDCPLTTIVSLNPTPPRSRRYGSLEEEVFKAADKEKCKVYVPSGSVEKYKSEPMWNLFWNILPLDDNSNRCNEPTISITGNKLLASSTTEASICEISVSSTDVKNATNSIDLSGVYNISCYAHAEGYLNSETVTATLVWVNPTLKDDQKPSYIINMDMKKAVLISSADGAIRVCGTREGEEISLYSIDGKLLSAVAANGDEMIIGAALQKGEIYVLKIGDKTIKYKF